MLNNCCRIINDPQLLDRQAWNSFIMIKCIILTFLIHSYEDTLPDYFVLNWIVMQDLLWENWITSHFV